ncbi:MAG: endonuclease MutS2 [Trueperaceae bacterium]|nr:endonuclease MutS2 [Trueperaceae bacterium]
MDTDAALLDKLAFGRVRAALRDRAATQLGAERAERLVPLGTREEAEVRLARVREVRSGEELPLGGIEDVRPLLERARSGRMLEGREILSLAYTLDGASRLRRTVVEGDRPALAELAARMGAFDGWLRLVREQLDGEGEVRDDATPKLREIRRRLKPLRGRIRDKMHKLLEQYADAVQDPIITLRRDRYVIPIQASAQARVPGIALDSSDSGRTVFVEPQSVVAMNNELALLIFEERDEVRRILLELGRQIAGTDGVDETLEIVALLDLANASARLAEDWGLVEAVPGEQDGDVRLPDARHPLIEDCVPNDLDLGLERRLLVVTGPNAGGKTVLLKTLGLAVTMAQSGLFVAAGRPEEPPRLPWFDDVLVDIGDEQSIEASLSTYAGHLVNLSRIVRQAHPGTLVLIDELGSGTDPEEGAALSQAILEAVLETGARGLVTTHLAPLKVFASDTPGIRNAAMRFDVDALAPTFDMVVGQPGRSYALAIAERLGLPAPVLTRAGDVLGPEGERLERLLETLEAQRDALNERVREAEASRDEAQDEAARLRDEVARMREHEEALMADASARAEERLQATLQRATRLERTARSGPSEGRSEALDEIRRMREEARRDAHRPAKRRAAQAAPDGQAEAPPRLAPGVRVYVPEYEASGPVHEVRGDVVLVQLGLLRVEVPAQEVRIEEAARERASVRHEPVTPAFGATFDDELNLRGERAEQAVEKVRDFVLEAGAMKVGKVRILHGKGTGALRDAVRNYLKNEPRVERFEDAVPYEGGHGVTVAYLRS